eukprot:4621892-Pleurochrysis_carterae.AAC.2
MSQDKLRAPFRYPYPLIMKRVYHMTSKSKGRYKTADIQSLMCSVMPEWHCCGRCNPAKRSRWEAYSEHLRDAVGCRRPDPILR